MFIQIQTVDGQFFASDAVDMVSSGLGVQEWDELVSDVEDLLGSWRDMDYLALEIGGKKKYFNPVNIIWGEIVH